MIDTLEDQIAETLRDRPGQTASEIAGALGFDRSAINHALHGPLKGRVRQDRSYRWSLTAAANAVPASGDAAELGPVVDTDLGKLARYYLACLGFDEAGVSAFLTSRHGDLDYAELASLPRGATTPAFDEAAGRLLNVKPKDGARYGLHVGYPTAIADVRSHRTGWKGLMVEPILLFPVEQDPATGRLSLDLGFPIVNRKPLRRFTGAEPDALMHELVQLEQELGLDGDGAPPERDEIAMRLPSVRPRWPWREAIGPDALSGAQRPIGGVDAPGIYNRAILIRAEKSPFTSGLEQELRDLGRLPPERYRDTVLGRWLRPEAVPEPTEPPPPAPLLEVLPMNSEQRQAVTAALTRPMTVITGPPGTGKSQVVTNLLVNAAWMGKRVLFASKNNKAVDVVETRVNALGARPILMRVGARQYQARLAEYVMALLAAKATPSEREDYEEAGGIHDRLLQEFQSLDQASRELVDLRNEVDRLEQQVEGARGRLPPALFDEAGAIDLAGLERAIAALRAAADGLERRTAPWPARFVWPLARRRRRRAMAEARRSAAPLLGLAGVETADAAEDETGIARWREIAAAADARARDIEAVARYRRALRRLQQARPLEEIARQQAGVQGAIAENALRLWQLWLRIQPSRMPAAQRQRLGQYAAVLKMVIEAGSDGERSRSAWIEYRRLLKEIAPILPCWAVTALSARGKIEFDPGLFDIVVFDEASQCDIASALPLLFRAKAVVVIGDARQLSHISGLPRGQDHALMERQGLFPAFAEWAYAHQSLFDLAATRVAPDDVVTLVDHHRSHADIIGFSNAEFYERRLRVATRHDRLKTPARGEAGVTWIDVPGRVARPASGGAVNAIEVRAVVDALRDLVLSKRYAGTVGVVTPFVAQARAIDEAVRADAALPRALAQADFLADTVHKFQGDERDVMLFSPVVGAGIADGAVGFLRSNPNLFNVAITRARAQLIVVGDREACLRSDIGYLSRFARYAMSLDGAVEDDVAARLASLGPEYPRVAGTAVVSDWERVFYRALFAAGIRPIPQYPVEKYRLDFLVVAGERKLAIEVDGARYHRSWTGELCRRDQIRNQRLFELGYDVRRFWVYEIRDDIERCVRAVRAWQQRQA
jgi:very-short-patch-repair endonuclease